MPYLSVGEENSGSIDLYFEDHGSGKPVILIHGWPLSGASWERQIPILIQAGNRVITYDRRGFGDSSRPTFGFDYDTFAEDLHKLINHQHLHDITLVGFSMGGGEVARYIANYGTDRVSRAVFVSAVTPYMLKTENNPEGIDSQVFESMLGQIVADRPSFLNTFLQHFYNYDVYKRKLVSEEAVRMSWNVAADASFTATLDCVLAFTKTDFRDDLAKVDVPTLIVHGDSDRICPLEVTGKRTHEMVKNSNLVVVEGGPHGLNWTHDDILNDALLMFMGQQAQKLAA